METVLDHTYLRPGVVTRASAVGLAALGIGAGVLLACWGLSFFFHYDSSIVTRLAALTAKVEEIAQRPDRTGDVIAKLNDLASSITQKLDQIDVASIRSSIAGRLASIDERLEAFKRQPPIVTPGPSRTDEHGNVIKTEVTVFHTMKHEGGEVASGWKYPDGASADQHPTNQYCYWSSGALGGTTSQVTIHIAAKGVRLSNIGSVPKLEESVAEVHLVDRIRAMNYWTAVLRNAACHEAPGDVATWMRRRTSNDAYSRRSTQFNI
jgi:hypothetical protein